MSSWVIVGAGYTGGALARRLAAEGHEVVATHRSAGRGRAHDGAPGASRIVFDLAQPPGRTFPGAIVVCFAPPGGDPALEMQHLVDAAAAAASSTCRRPASTRPAGARGSTRSWPHRAGRRRRAARGSPPSARCPRAAVIALRAAGIYGPGRGLVERMRAGTYRIIGDGRAHVSRIHVDDLVETIVRGRPVGRDRRGSTSPTTIRLRSARSPMRSPHGSVCRRRRACAPTSVDPEVAGMLTADRRIANGRIKAELGVVLRYPSWRAAIA